MKILGKKTFRSEPVMNVTPLVDVVLVLLIIFMVVIPVMQKYTNIELPSIKNIDPEVKGKVGPFTLSIAKDGSIFFESKHLGLEQFTAMLREANQREPNRRLLLRADRESRFGDVRAIFKRCQELGFPGISLEVNEIRDTSEKR